MVPDGPLAFAVSVLFPSTRVEAVRSVPTEAAAAAWIISSRKQKTNPIRRNEAGRAFGSETHSPRRRPRATKHHEGTVRHT
jgi:hypothetical protein